VADRIHIRDLALRCVIGLYPAERRQKQDVVLNLTIEADLRAAGRSDDLADTVDYKAIKRAIIAAVERSRYRLVEALAERVAAIALRHRGVHRVTVCVDKPGALRFARSVAVEIARERPAAARRRR
jgi:dihydroneopterin aldolase/D-erythro-7,8-dihydroneopterin triphosphate epimerase